FLGRSRGRRALRGLSAVRSRRRGSRSARGSPRRGRRSFPGGRRKRLDDRLLRASLHDRQDDREHDETDESAGRQLVQKGRRAARSESRLASSTPEGAGDVGPLALLEQDHEDQEEADDDVNDDETDIQHEASIGIGRKSRKGREVYAA